MPGLSRKRQAPAEDEDDSNVEEEVEEEEQASTGIEDMVKALVRLALAAEYQRRPLRRQEISEKVLGQHSRSFKKVFARAQEELKAIFGMELVELPAKDKVTAQQKRTAQQKQDSARPAASYMLCSILPTAYRTPDIIRPSAIPTAQEDAQYTGIYTMLVSLVSLHGGTLTEAKMERYLTRMGLEDNTPIAGYEKTEKLIKRIEKDGYLVKIREPLGNNGEEEVSWTVGPRGKVEIGDAGVQGLVSQAYGNPEGEEAAELSKRVDRSLGVHERPPPAEKKSRAKAKKAPNDDDD